VCRVSGLCLIEKERNGERWGDRISKIGLLELRLKRLPLRGGFVGSSAQSLNLPSVAIEATRFGCIVDGNQWIFAKGQYLNPAQLFKSIPL
jgi:hypothetical protein